MLREASLPIRSLALLMHSVCVPPPHTTPPTLSHKHPPTLSHTTTHNNTHHHSHMARVPSGRQGGAPWHTASRGTGAHRVGRPAPSDVHHPPQCGGYIPRLDAGAGGVGVQQRPQCCSQRCAFSHTLVFPTCFIPVNSFPTCFISPRAYVSNAWRMRRHTHTLRHTGDVPPWATDQAGSTPPPPSPIRTPSPGPLVHTDSAHLSLVSASTGPADLGGLHDSHRDSAEEPEGCSTGESENTAGGGAQAPGVPLPQAEVPARAEPPPIQTCVMMVRCRSGWDCWGLHVSIRYLCSIYNPSTIKKGCGWCRLLCYDTQDGCMRCARRANACATCIVGVYDVYDASVIRCNSIHVFLCPPGVV